MQRVTACIAAALLLVALLIGFLSENATARGAIFEGNVRCERRCSIDASVVAQFKTFGLPAKSFLTPWTPSQICLENSTVKRTNSIRQSGRPISISTVQAEA